MNLFYRSIIWISIFILAFSCPLSGQDEPGGLYLTGKVTTEQGNVDGSIIKMTRNGQVLKDYNVLPDGKFNLRFEFNNDYILIFSRTGNFPQKVTISTTVPAEVLRRDRKFPPFPLDINLFTEVKGIDRTFSENAILKIFYSGSVDNFIPEVYYNNPQIKRLIDQAIWQSQHVTKESDLLKKLTAAELAELKKEYDGYLKKAGAEFDKGEYINSLGDYKAASRVFPGEQYPKDRIAEINDLIAVLGLQQELERQMAEKYGKFIQIADQHFISKEYIEAKDNYTQALYIRPGDNYATGRLTEIDRLMAAMETDKKYSDFVALADKAFNEKLWDQAKTRYNEALRLKPGETYPVSQIAKIDAELLLLTQQAEKKENFDAAVMNGDAAYAKQFYSKAIAFYETALTYKQGDQGVLTKIKKIRNEQKVIADKLFYDETIANADKAFNKKEYDKAKEMYSTALTSGPGQSYPQKQIEIIDRIFGKNKEYDQIISGADALFNKQEYIRAREEFRNALSLKPEEDYPVRKIKEIDGIIVSQEKADQAYRLLITGADKLFNENKLALAKIEFQKAASQRPSDTYPPEMLTKISASEAELARLSAEKEAAEKNRLLSEQELINQKYKSLIDEADLFANQNKLVEAVGKFRAALEVKPQESYPLKRIEEIRGIISRQTEAKKAYDAAIARGDQAYGKEQYPSARMAYQQAQQAKSDEKYPAGMLAKIDSVEAEQARLAADKQAREEAARLAALSEKERLYSETVTRADGFFDQKQYLQAIADYRNALKIKPGESYLQQRITECERIFSEMAAAQKAYDAAILTADKAFRQLQYGPARTFYQQAQQVKSDEKYPGEMLAKIDAIEAEQARLAADKQAREEAARLAALSEKERLYSEAVTRADGFFDQKQYPQAIADYRNALKIKPGESHPQQRITECERIISELAAAQKAYDAAILAADKAFRQLQYGPARTGYQQAQQAKSDEKYPAGMLAKIDSVEAEQARLAADKQAREEAAIQAVKQKYEQAITLADKALSNDLLDEAGKGYGEAQRIKPDENYPAQQIARISELRAAKLQGQFSTLIDKGDQALLKDEFDLAEKNYRDAGRLIPSDSRIAGKLAETDRLRREKMQALLDAENKNREYIRLITLADRAFGNNSFSDASVNYRSALNVKPEEIYPKTRLEKIDSILKVKAIDEQYRSILLAADAAFRTSNLTLARENYSRALELKPAEEYPKKQIQKIDVMLQQIAQRSQASAVMKENARGKEVTPSPDTQKDRMINDETEALYSSLITTADQAFNDKEYNVSRAWYYKALEIKPGEPYPTGRIDEINKIIGNMQMTQSEREFQQYIDKADDAFRNDQLAVARSWYNRALVIKANDEYSKSQLTEIQIKINERLQGDTNKTYVAYMEQGNRAFEQKQFIVARVWFQRALQIKHGDEQSLQKLEAIKKAMAGE